MRITQSELRHPRLLTRAGGKGDLCPLGTPPPQTCTDRRENHNAQPLVNNSG